MDDAQLHDIFRNISHRMARIEKHIGLAPPEPHFQLTRVMQGHNPDQIDAYRYTSVLDQFGVPPSPVKDEDDGV